MRTNPLLSQVHRCPACGAPEFRFHHDDESDRDPAEPQSWFLIQREPEPIAGGIIPARACTNCGRIAEGSDGRAIVWNVDANGSPIPRLVPPVDLPLTTVYNSCEWEDEHAIDMLHLICLRGRWADDLALEATATGWLLDTERRREQYVYTDELRERANRLLDDDRLPWVHQVDLLHELGLDAAARNDHELAYQHLSGASRLANDPAARETFWREAPYDERFALPNSTELATDAAEQATSTDHEAEALLLLRDGGAPWRGEDMMDMRHSASVGLLLARELGDPEFALQCLLCIALDDALTGTSDDLDERWTQIEELLSGEDGERLRQQAIDTVRGWRHYDGPRRAILTKLGVPEVEG